MPRRRTRSRPESTPEAALDAGLRLLARREHSAAELRVKLQRRGFATAHIDQALAQLATRGWQSDARYALARARSRSGAGCGPLRIRADLAAAGVRDDLAEQALSELDGELDWAEQARAALARRYPEPPASARDWQRRYRFLAGRGFPHELIRRLLGDVPQGDPGLE